MKAEAVQCANLQHRPLPGSGQCPRQRRAAKTIPGGGIYCATDGWPAFQHRAMARKLTGRIHGQAPQSKSRILRISARIARRWAWHEVKSMKIGKVFRHWPPCRSAAILPSCWRWLFVRRCGAGGVANRFPSSQSGQKNKVQYALDSAVLSPARCCRQGGGSEEALSDADVKGYMAALLKEQGRRYRLHTRDGLRSIRQTRIFTA